MAPTKADLLFQYSGLYLLLFATQFANVLSTRVHVVLTPGDSTLVKYVNSSSMVTCTPSLAQLKVRWISPSGHVVSPIITERIHAEYRGHGAMALVLGWVNAKDAGDYKCELTGRAAEDEQDEEIWQGFTLHVIRDIVFADTAIVQEGAEGETGVIRCEASGDPQPELRWYHNGKPIPEPSRKYSRIADGLAIYGLERSDSGEYTCRAVQVSAHISSTKAKVIRYNVLHAPIFTNKRHVFYGYYYGTAELKCEVVADPPARIKWTSKPVPQEYYTVHNSSINSSILEVAVNDPVVIGRYTCIAENDLGSAELVVELRNGSKPEPPKRFIIKGVNNTTVHIEVEQEENENDTMSSLDESDVVSGYRFHFITLDNYRKYRQRKSDNFWVQQGEVNKNFSESNSYLVGGLRPNTIYKMRVASLNQAGPSDFTQDKEFTTSEGGIKWASSMVILFNIFVVVVFRIQGFN